ncbi:hypothetical protein GIB67_023429 [Kingdonia uniflora]|uniref:TF-B3 domain-containing protein n=1 Tax=Kingdonia uniflora TaxID=39325 RepID=A0A7J7PAC8_9MAGN|nr:hypothetical protein GIB67_023429 [Kingdonia uniflora]
MTMKFVYFDKEGAVGMEVADHDETSARKGTCVDNDKTITGATERAKEFQKNLDPKHPSFVKVMVRSHVSGCCLVGLPSQFIRSYLPKNDMTFSLVDENAKTFSVKFVGRGFSAGWRLFTTTHNLVEGDALVFQLIKPDEFKVFIIKAESLSVVNGGFGLQKSEAHEKKEAPQVYASAEAKPNTTNKVEALESGLKPGSPNLIKPALQSEMTVGSCLVADNPSAMDLSAKSSAKERAVEVQQNLDPEHPSFVKSMARSNVASGFWLGIPSQFCNSYLPKAEVMITLVDENDEECEVKFVGKAFSAGWTGFATAHKLVEGDALVFELVKDAKFKVYILRANISCGSDGGLVLSNTDSQAKRSSSCKRVKTSEKTKRKRQKILPLTDLGQREGEESKNNSGEASSEVSGSAMSWGNLDRKRFDVAVDGLWKKSKLPEHMWTKYYELCCRKKKFLHKNLPHDNTVLVDGIIKQTVTVADSIKACKLSTCSDEQFDSWDKYLKGFEELGMDVGFLRVKVQRLKKLASKSEHESYSKSHIEAIANRVSLQKDMKRLEKKLAGKKEAAKKLDAEIDNLIKKVERDELEFQKEVDAP